MKKLTAIVIVLLFVGICYAQMTPVVIYDRYRKEFDPGAQQTYSNVWASVASNSSSGDEPANLGTASRTYSVVRSLIGANASGTGEIKLASITPRDNRCRFRCLGNADNASVVYQLYIGTLGNAKHSWEAGLSSGTDCILAYAGQLTWTIGLQSSTESNYNVADTIAVTSSDWAMGWITVSPGSDRVAEAYIDFMGADTLVMIPTTLGCDAQLIMKGF